MIDVLQRLDDELDRTPHGAYACRPLPRSIIAAAAAEIRRLRAQIALAAAQAAETHDEPAERE